VNEAMESVYVRENDETLRGRRAHAHLPCKDRGDVKDTSGVPVKVPGAFVVDLLEDTGTFERGEVELLLSWFEWVELEVRGVPRLLEGLCRLRGAVMKAAAAGRVV